MPRRKIHQEQVRNIQQSHGSYYVTIPIHVIRDLGWQERQKVVVEKYGDDKVLITDWEE